jgi:hypothetical protein
MGGDGKVIGLARDKARQGVGGLVTDVDIRCYVPMGLPVIHGIASHFRRVVVEIVPGQQHLSRLDGDDHCKNTGESGKSRRDQGLITDSHATVDGLAMTGR